MQKQRTAPQAISVGQKHREKVGNARACGKQLELRCFFRKSVSAYQRNCAAVRCEVMETRRKQRLMSRHRLLRLLCFSMAAAMMAAILRRQSCDLVVRSGLYAAALSMQSYQAVPDSISPQCLSENFIHNNTAVKLKTLLS